MTFRAKPTAKRPHRTAYEADHRRTIILNIAFGLVVLLALLILAGAGFASWYGDHLAGLATVNGQTITKDDFRDRAKVDVYRLDYRETQIRQRIQDGRLASSTGESQISRITQARSTIATDVMEQLIDSSLQAQLAAQQGITVTDQQIDDAMTKDASTPESRHLWVIGIKPALTGDATAPTDQQKADAKAKAVQGLADLKAGKAWADVAKTMPDDFYASKDGDVGWVTKGSSVFDADFEATLFTLPVNGLTDVVEGKDGVFRIGRVSEIDPPAVDQAFQQKIKDAGVGLDSYRRAARTGALRQALNDKLVADANQVTTQRHIAEIFIAADATGQQGTGDEVQVRHILFSPNDDANGAQSLDAADPAWKKAQDDANAAYALLQKDPKQFIDLARNNSDDTGTKADGGLLPYYTKANLDPAFGTAIFADGLVKDQILPPVKSAFGYHIIQFLDRRKPAAERVADIKTQAAAPGADFAALASTYSEASTKDKGGDAGWIAKYQFDSVREIAIFKAQVGGVTDVITTAQGIYLYKVLAEENRVPDATQADQLKANAFSNWYASEKNAAHIDKLYSTSQANIPTIQ